MKRPTRIVTRPRGSVYLLVVGCCLIASVLAVGGLLAGIAQTRAARLASDSAAAQLAARSGLELARNWINSDANWRTNRTNGTWTSNLAIGTAVVSLDVTDPLDGNLSNRPYDPVVVTCTATVGQATQAISVTLNAKPTALPVMAYAMHSNGQVRIEGNSLKLGTADASTNGELRNDGTIEGDCIASSYNPKGIVFGDASTGVAARTLPGSAMVTAYTGLGTVISPGGLIDKRLLTPGANPWGATNADGVYVINSGSNVTLRNSRINGTLVVNCPGKTVTIEASLLMQPARADFPVLIVDGNVNLQFTSTTPLSESSTGVNFNPIGAGYAGVADGDQTDTYPSEIQGLVYVTGSIQWSMTSTIRGAVFSAATGSNAIDLSGTGTIVWDGSLYASPPQWFTSQVQMIPQANTVKQVVH